MGAIVGIWPTFRPGWIKELREQAVRVKIQRIERGRAFEFGYAFQLITR